MSEVSLKQISKYYGRAKAVDQVDLTVGTGSFFTLLGPSGCGKTTLLRMISGFIAPTAGDVFINGRRATHLPPEKREVGMVFQNYALFPHLTVHDNVAYGLRVQSFPRKTIRDRVHKYLEIVKLDDYGQRRISELSGGQQQRVALARSLVVEPKILLLDEPLSNLDARLRDAMRLELKQIQKILGVTTIYVTHDQTEALTMSDRIAVFKDGYCRQTGTPKEIYDHPQDAFVAGFIGDTNLLKVRWDQGQAWINQQTAITVEDETRGQYVSIRPENILVSKVRQNALNELTGRIEFEQFNGPQSFYLVNTEGVTLKILKTHRPGLDGDLTVGQKIYLTLPPDVVRVVAGP